MIVPAILAVVAAVVLLAGLLAWLVRNGWLSE